MLTNEQIRVPKIKAAQLSALLILSRMFIILIFLPNTHHSVGGSVAILSIIVGFFLTFLVMIPLFFLLRQYPRNEFAAGSKTAFSRSGKV